MPGLVPPESFSMSPSVLLLSESGLYSANCFFFISRTLWLVLKSFHSESFPVPLIVVASLCMSNLRVQRLPSLGQDIHPSTLLSAVLIMALDGRFIILLGRKLLFLAVVCHSPNLGFLKSQI